MRVNPKIRRYPERKDSPVLRRERVILVIMDGLGLSQIPNHDSNAFHLAYKPHLDTLWRTMPMCSVDASGRAVGLPDGQMGNSEVGHQNIGAGRVVYQDITRIDRAIETGEFARLPALQDAFAYVRQNGAVLHLIGLLSDGGVHSSMMHLEALLQEASRAGLKKVAVHALMDGRDTSPHGGVEYIRHIEAVCRDLGVGGIATVTGRYYAMDRDNRWERVRKAYEAMTDGNGRRYASADEAIRDSYARDVTDEFVEPSVILKDGRPLADIRERDAVIFFNFRADRARQLTRAFTQPVFDKFPVKPLQLHFTTMTRYEEDFDLPVLFPPLSLKRILGEIISETGRKQLRIAETEKYAHVTYFFNGGDEKIFPGEDRILVPSPKVATYDLQPEMSQPEVTRRVVAAISGETYHLIVLNFANCDMVGHTGKLEAAVKAVEAVNDGVEQVQRAAFEHQYAMILTADHGNCEMMVDPINGGPFTAHTTNPVPLFVLDRDRKVRLRPTGRLCDIAPTILQILGMPQPPEMEGESLMIE